MDAVIHSHLFQGFVAGLAIGLTLAIITWFKGLNRQRSLAKENKKLSEHLHTQMTISAKGNRATEKELEELKKQCENLRITVATLKSKPGKGELHTLQLYDKAIHLMYEKAPGFAPAWESVMKEAETEMKKTDNGFKALIRKVIRPALPSATSTSESETGNPADMDLLKSKQD